MQSANHHRPLDEAKAKKLTTVLVKWEAADCRPVNIVEDLHLRDVLWLACCDLSYAMYSLYETERN